jgi:hypothetical protein
VTFINQENPDKSDAGLSSAPALEVPENGRGNDGFI